MCNQVPLFAHPFKGTCLISGEWRPVSAWNTSSCAAHSSFMWEKSGWSSSTPSWSLGCTTSRCGQTSLTSGVRPEAAPWSTPYHGEAFGKVGWFVLGHEAPPLLGGIRQRLLEVMVFSSLPPKNPLLILLGEYSFTGVSISLSLKSAGIRHLKLQVGGRDKWEEELINGPKMC